MSFRKPKKTLPHQWNIKFARPQCYKSIVDWFQKGWIRIGDPSKPHSMFTPNDNFKFAVVINNQLRYQLPKHQPEPPQYEYQIIEGILN